MLPSQDGIHACIFVRTWVVEHPLWTLLRIGAFSRRFWKKKIYARRLKSRQIWLPLSDRETEDVWKDHSGTTIQNYTLPWIGGTADGKKIENCARIIDEKIWGDKRCDFPEFACVCSYKPNFHLKLRGLCPSSAIDVFFKPMNDWADFRQLKLQGLK